MIRILNLHPRIQQSLSAKPLFAIEVGDDAAVLYSVGETPDAIESLDDVLVDQFYWYIGPETSTIHEAEIGRHTSELQSLMRISYAVFCLKKKIHHTT